MTKLLLKLFKVYCFQQTNLTTKTQNVFVTQQTVERSLSPEEEHSFQ